MKPSALRIPHAVAATALAWLFSLVLAVSCFASGFTLEQVMSSPFAAQLVSASHSGRVAWVFTVKGARNVWVADPPSFAARQVTQYSGDDGLPIASLRITPDGRTVVYARGTETNEAGRVADPTSGVSSRKQLVFALDVDGEGPRLVGEMGCGEEDCEDIQISPDGQLVVAIGPDQKGYIYPSAGGEPRTVNGMDPGDLPITWNQDGSSIYLYRTGEVPAKIYQLELATGKKTVWKQIVPTDPTGLSTIGPILITPDGKTYVYGFHRTLADLYLVEGLK